MWNTYVFTDVDTTLVGPATVRTMLKAFPRWAVGEVDSDLLEAAAIIGT